MKSKSAFTLIELLVVIAIVSILAVILFPVFATAREKGRQAACTSNMKQLGLALIEYTQDYDEHLPFDEESGGWGTGWAHQIYPYIKSAPAFTCPDDLTVAPSGNVVYSYLMNHNAIATSSTNGAISTMTAPALSIAMYEGSNVTGLPPSNTAELNSEAAIGGGGSNYPTDTWAADYTGQAGYQITIWEDTGQFAGRFVPLGGTAAGAGGLDPAYPTGRHSVGSNYMMFDGHVKALRGSQVSSGPNPTSASASCTQDTSGCWGTSPAHGNYTNAATTASLGSTYAATFSTL